MPNNQAYDPRVALAVDRQVANIVLAVASILNGGDGPVSDSTLLAALYLTLYPNHQGWGAGTKDEVSTWMYASVTGSGTGDGSLGNPFSLTQALTADLAPGTGVKLLSGAYSLTSSVTTISNGSLGAPVWFTSDDPSNPAVINGSGTGKLLTQQNSYTGFSDLEITAMDGVGIGQGSEGIASDHLTVEKCYFHDIEGNQGDNISCLRMDRVSQSAFRNNLIENITAIGGTTDGHGYETYSGFNNIFEHNEVINTAKGFYIKVPSTQANNGHIVRRNIFKDIRQQWYEIYGNDSVNVINEGNLVGENLVLRSGGFRDFTLDIDLQCSDLRIFNNTLIDAGFTFDGHAGVRAFNNIIDKTPGAAEADQLLIIRPGLANNSVTEIVEWNYNCYPQNTWVYVQDTGTNYPDLTAWQGATNASSALNFPAGGPDSDSIADVDPLFTNPAADDYTLASGSPCIGAGKGGDNIGAYATQNSVIGRVA